MDPNALRRWETAALVSAIVIALAILVALFYFGWCITRFLFPREWQTYELLSAPFVGYALIVTFDYIALFFGINLTLGNQDPVRDYQLAKFFPGARKEHQLNRPLDIFYRRETHRFSALGLVQAEPGDHSCDTDFLLIVNTAQCR